MNMIMDKLKLEIIVLVDEVVHESGAQLVVFQNITGSFSCFTRAPENERKKDHKFDQILLFHDFQISSRLVYVGYGWRRE